MGPEGGSLEPLEPPLNPPLTIMMCYDFKKHLLYAPYTVVLSRSQWPHCEEKHYQDYVIFLLFFCCCYFCCYFNKKHCFILKTFIIQIKTYLCFTVVTVIEREKDNLVVSRLTRLFLVHLK